MKLTSPNPSARLRGMYLIECLVYIAVLALVLGVASTAFFRCWDDTKHLRRNADDIVRALHAGEQWRADLRAATRSVQVADQGGAETVVIPVAAGRITYVYAQGEVHRQPPGYSHAILVLDRVNASRMLAEPRREVTAWRCELELSAGRKNVRMPPLFTFETVAGRPKTP